MPRVGGLKTSTVCFSPIFRSSARKCGAESCAGVSAELNAGRSFTRIYSGLRGSNVGMILSNIFGRIKENF